MDWKTLSLAFLLFASISAATTFIETKTCTNTSAATGACSDTNAIDGTTWNVSEPNGVSFNATITITNASIIRTQPITIRSLAGYYYSGGVHYVEYSIYNQTAGAWYKVANLSLNSLGWINTTLSGTDFASSGGAVYVRYEHASAGNPIHTGLLVDYFAVDGSSIIPSCPYDITTNNGYYELNQSITTTGTYCIKVFANTTNNTINGKGFTITGRNDSIAIDIRGDNVLVENVSYQGVPTLDIGIGTDADANNTTIRNCTATGGYLNFALDGTYGLIENITSINHTGAGVAMGLGTGSRNTLNRAYLRTNSTTAFGITGASANSIAANSTIIGAKGATMSATNLTYRNLTINITGTTGVAINATSTASNALMDRLSISYNTSTTGDTAIWTASGATFTITDSMLIGINTSNSKGIANYGNGTIRNTNASRFFWGFYEAGKSTSYTNITASQGDNYAFYGVSCSNTTISNTTLYITANSPIYTSLCNGTTIRDTNSTSVLYAAIAIVGGSGALIANTTATSTSNPGILLEATTNNTIDNANVSASAGRGIYLNNGANGNTITNSRVFSGSSQAIRVDSSANNIITNTAVNTTSGTGIYIPVSNNTTISNTNATSTSGTPFFIDKGHNNRILNSNSSSSTSYAIRIDGVSNNTLIENTTASSVFQYSIYAASGWNGINISQTNSTSTNTAAVRLDNGANMAIESGKFRGSSGIVLVNITNATINRADVNVSSVAISFGNLMNQTAISNSSISGSTYGIYISGTARNGKIINNTIYSNNIQLFFQGTSTGNFTMYWNNFTETGNYYAYGAGDGTNQYNSSECGQNEGNVYANAINGDKYLWNFWGSPPSIGYPEFYTATEGSLPYDYISSQGKVGTGIEDHAPITPYNSEPPCRCGMVFTKDNTGCTFTSDDTNSTEQSCIIIAANNITIEGAGYTAYNKFLSGGTASFGIRITSGSNPTIRNLNLNNFTYGIYADTITDLTATDMNITADKGSTGGQPVGIAASSSTNLILSGINVSVSTDYTAIGISASSAGMSITNSTFAANGVSESFGGYISGETTDASITNTAFTGDGGLGTGLKLYTEGNTLRNITISNFTATGTDQGGTIFNYAGTYGIIEALFLSDCSMIGANTAGLYSFWGHNTTISNCTIEGLTYGFDSEGDGTTNPTEITLSGSIMNATSADGTGGGAYIISSGRITIENSTIESASPSAYGTYDLTYNSSLKNNDIISAGAGAYMQSPTSTDQYATMQDNRITGFTYGLIMTETGNNLIKNNTIGATESSGALLTGSQGSNRMCWNNFTGGAYYIYDEVVKATSCHQESTNISNQSGTDGDCGLNYTGSTTLGDWEGTPVLLLNYSHPSDTSIYEARWTIKDYFSTEAPYMQLDIGAAYSNCYYADPIQLAIQQFGGDGMIYTYYWCYDGIEAWQLLYFSENSYEAGDPNDISLIYDGDWDTSASIYETEGATAAGGEIYEESIEWLGIAASNGNLYNASECNGEGNVYANVMDGSVNISGLTYSLGYPVLYVGINGDLPYNETTSLGKMFGATDYAPLTPNLYVAPIYNGTLIIKKFVINGTAIPSDFNISVDGVNFSASFSGDNDSGQNLSLNPGAYSVSEIQNANYSVSYSGDCSDFVLAENTTYYCNITNTYNYTEPIQPGGGGGGGGINIEYKPGSYDIGGIIGGFCPSQCAEGDDVCPIKEWLCGMTYCAPNWIIAAVILLLLLANRRRK